MQIVDRRGDPLPGADVALFLPHLPAGYTRAEHRLAGPPFAELRADAVGRCRVSIERECFIEAHQAGVGSSGDVRVAPGMTWPTGMLRLTVAPQVHVTGVVLLPDGGPATGATVATWFADGPMLGVLAAPPPLTSTDERGAFACDLTAPGRYRINASLGDLHALEELDVEVDGSAVALRMQLPGAYSVRAVLLDPRGAPLAGTAILAGDDNGSWCERTDDAGTCLWRLRAGGRFDLYGGREGSAFGHEVVELTAVRPHQEVTLRTKPLRPVAGRVVDERGQPIRGLDVAFHETDAEMTRALGGEHFWKWSMTETEPDGSFRVLLPADMPFRIRYSVGYGPYDTSVDGPVVTPPAEDLQIVVSDADRQRRATGFELWPRVVSAASGEPIANVSIGHYMESDSDCAFTDGACHRSDGRIMVGPVGLRWRSVWFEFRAAGFAPLSIGPYEVTERVEEVTVRMLSHATLDVHVQRTDGTPAIGARVRALGGAPEVPFQEHDEGLTDADGRVHFDRLRPGALTVHAWLQGERIDRVDRDVTLVSGGHDELRLVFPR